MIASFGEGLSDRNQQSYNFACEAIHQALGCDWLRAFDRGLGVGGGGGGGWVERHGVLSPWEGWQGKPELARLISRTRQDLRIGSAGYQ